MTENHVDVTFSRNTDIPPKCSICRQPIKENEEYVDIQPLTRCTHITEEKVTESSSRTEAGIYLHHSCVTEIDEGHDQLWPNIGAAILNQIFSKEDRGEEA